MSETQELSMLYEEFMTNLRWQIAVAIIIYTVIQILFAIAIVNYAAVKNSKVFNYDKLAKKIAKEIKATHANTGSNNQVHKQVEGKEESQGA